MALLFLDNTAEILMHRALEIEFHYDNERARSEESGYQPISKHRRNNINRLFPSKVEFLVEKGRIEKTVGDVIKALHRYRNDAYHRDKVRGETVSAAATVYLEIDCELLVSLPPSGMLYSSEDDWSEFMRRFNLGGPVVVVPSDLELIAKKLRDEVGLDTNALGATLADHLVSRVETINEQLEFISENASKPTASSEEELERVQQYWKRHGPLSWSNGSLPWSEVQKQPAYTANELTTWREKAESLRQTSNANRLNFLRRFSDLEQRMEPLEAMVDEVAFQVDEAIQLEIDRFRGK